MSESEHHGRVFPRWATALFRAVLLALLALVVLVPGLLWAWQRTPYLSDRLDPKVQPVKFDHRHHVHDDGISCVYCHADVFRSPSAGIPALSVCMGCHAQIWPHSPELAPVRDGYAGHGTLEWRRVTRLPDFVFFDHSAHTNRGVPCVMCHGRVDTMPQVYSVEPFNMKFCIDCHRAPAGRVGAKADVIDPEWTPPAHSPDVHPRTDCTTCHR